MGLIAARCTQCGAEIEVDDTKEAGICKYCGTAFITEKVINNYTTYVTNNEIHNYAGATIITKQDKEEYLCPKCKSSETRAIKLLNTPAPKLLSHKTGLTWSVIFLFLFGLTALGSLVKLEIAIGLFYIGLTGCMYLVYLHYKNSQENDDKINRDNLYKYEHTYHCLRCGENYIVNDDISDK